jgi:hypothetical protein
MRTRSLTFHPSVLMSRYVWLLICFRVLDADGSFSQFLTNNTFVAQRQPQPQPQAQFEPASTGFAVDQWSSVPAVPGFVSPPSGSAVPSASAAPVAQGSNAWSFNSATPVDFTPIDDNNSYNNGYDYTYTYDTYRSSPLGDLNGLRGLPKSATPSMPSFDPDTPFELSAEPYHVQASLGSLNSMESMDPMNYMATGGVGALSSSAPYEYDPRLLSHVCWRKLMRPHQHSKLHKKFVMRYKI